MVTQEDMDCMHARMSLLMELMRQRPREEWQLLMVRSAGADSNDAALKEKRAAILRQLVAEYTDIWKKQYPGIPVWPDGEDAHRILEAMERCKGREE